jgi:hypothetical protein
MNLRKGHLAARVLASAFGEDSVDELEDLVKVSIYLYISCLIMVKYAM